MLSQLEMLALFQSTRQVFCAYQNKTVCKKQFISSYASVLLIRTTEKEIDLDTHAFPHLT